MISIIFIFSDYFSVFGSLLEEDGMCLQSFTNLSDDCLKTVNQRKYTHEQLSCQKLWTTQSFINLETHKNNSKYKHKYICLVII